MPSCPQNAIIILDEGHNIEKVSEEVMSTKLSSTQIAYCIEEVTEVSLIVIHLIKYTWCPKPPAPGFLLGYYGSDEVKDYWGEEGIDPEESKFHQSKALQSFLGSKKGSPGLVPVTDKRGHHHNSETISKKEKNITF